MGHEQKAIFPHITTFEYFGYPEETMGENAMHLPVEDVSLNSAKKSTKAVDTEANVNQDVPLPDFGQIFQTFAQDLSREMENYFSNVLQTHADCVKMSQLPLDNAVETNDFNEAQSENIPSTCANSSLAMKSAEEVSEDFWESESHSYPKVNVTFQKASFGRTDLVQRHEMSLSKPEQKHSIGEWNCGPAPAESNSEQLRPPPAPPPFQSGKEFQADNASASKDVFFPSRQFEEYCNPFLQNSNIALENVGVSISPFQQSNESCTKFSTTAFH